MKSILVNNIYELITLYNSLKDKKVLKYYLDHRSQVLSVQEDPRLHTNMNGYRDFVMRNSKQNNLPQIIKKFILKLPLFPQSKRYQLFYLLDRYATSNKAYYPVVVEMSAKLFKDISLIGDEREQNKLIDMTNKIKYLVINFIPKQLIRKQH